MTTPIATPTGNASTGSAWSTGILSAEATASTFGGPPSLPGAYPQQVRVEAGARHGGLPGSGTRSQCRSIPPTNLPPARVRVTRRSPPGDHRPWLRAGWRPPGRYRGATCPPDADHAAALDLLRTVDAQPAAALGRLLGRKQQAAYESRDISARDAATCIRQATTLVDAARSRALRA